MSWPWQRLLALALALFGCGDLAAAQGLPAAIGDRPGDERSAGAGLILAGITCRGQAAPLPGIRHDLPIVRELFQRRFGVGDAPGDVRTLCDATTLAAPRVAGVAEPCQGSVRDLAAVARELTAGRPATVPFVVYAASHGTIPEPGASPQLCFADDRLAVVEDLIRPLRAAIGPERPLLVLLDACNAGAALDVPWEREPELAARLGPGVQVLAASYGTAWEIRQGPRAGSLFLGALRRALLPGAGEAGRGGRREDPDYDCSGGLSLDEVAFRVDEVLTEAGRFLQAPAEARNLVSRAARGRSWPFQRVVTYRAAAARDLAPVLLPRADAECATLRRLATALGQPASSGQGAILTPAQLRWLRLDLSRAEGLRPPDDPQALRFLLFEAGVPGLAEELENMRPQLSFRVQALPASIQAEDLARVLFRQGAGSAEPQGRGHSELMLLRVTRQDDDLALRLVDGRTGLLWGIATARRIEGRWQLRSCPDAAALPPTPDTACSTPPCGAAESEPGRPLVGALLRCVLRSAPLTGHVAAVDVAGGRGPAPLLRLRADPGQPPLGAAEQGRVLQIVRATSQGAGLNEAVIGRAVVVPVAPCRAAAGVEGCFAARVCIPPGKQHAPRAAAGDRYRSLPFRPRTDCY